MLLSPDSETALQAIIQALASSMAMFAVGRSLGKGPVQAMAAAAGITGNKLTFLEQSYLAGKVAQQLGPDKVASMTAAQVADWLKVNPIRMTTRDRAVLGQMKDETERWLKGGSERWQQKAREALTVTDREWRASLLTQKYEDVAAVSVARNTALQNLKARLGDGLAGFTGDVNRLAQSEMMGYFQKGFVADMEPEEMVYKIPLPGACNNCLRVHLEADGTPRRVPISEAMMNDNTGVPASLWEFTIGPLHPHCYCMLYSEEQMPVEPDEGLATIREEALKKSESKPVVLEPRDDPGAHERFLIAYLNTIMAPPQL